MNITNVAATPAACEGRKTWVRSYIIYDGDKLVQEYKRRLQP